MKNQDRKNRIVARGEHSNHSHIVVGDAEVTNKNGEIFIKVGPNGATIKHLLESNWLAGQEVWTKEHTDIELPANTDYKYVPQLEYDPYAETIRAVQD